eukprot:CAMPEP_0182431314 /NCGR_PEP_ID=MMETSP1167-20130531/48127_1 /TAXON_ID=2988 /ORGANISM="Mallomonas Sp, Strain CCMP3275" /LENGTH=280 /DNA_ID=CAMNT_0024617509 /DNA_START=445 /DNA_END=1287 /DNA_ORIENTATION=+
MTNEQRLAADWMAQVQRQQMQRLQQEKLIETGDHELHSNIQSNTHNTHSLSVPTNHVSPTAKSQMYPSTISGSSIQHTNPIHRYTASPSHQSPPLPSSLSQSQSQSQSLHNHTVPPSQGTQSQLHPSDVRRMQQIYFQQQQIQQQHIQQQQVQQAQQAQQHYQYHSHSLPASLHMASAADRERIRESDPYAHTQSLHAQGPPSSISGSGHPYRAGVPGPVGGFGPMHGYNHGGVYSSMPGSELGYRRQMSNDDGREEREGGRHLNMMEDNKDNTDDNRNG